MPFERSKSRRANLGLRVRPFKGKVGVEGFEDGGNERFLGPSASAKTMAAATDLLVVRMCTDLFVQPFGAF